MNDKPIPHHMEMVRKGFDLTAAMDAEIHACRDRIAELEKLLAARRQPDAGVVKRVPFQLPNDYAEDIGHENGSYQNACSNCGLTFFGHKRRVTCKVCTTPPASPVPASVRAAILEEAAELCDAYRQEDYSGVAPSLAAAIRALASKEAAPEQGCDSMDDTKRLDFIEKYEATWYSRRHTKDIGILCYEKDGQRAEALGSSFRKAIDAAIAAKGDGK